MKTTYQMFLTIALLIGAIGLTAQNTFGVSECSIKINGTSSLHDWTSTAEDVSGTAQLDVANQTLNAIEALTVRIKSEGIKSEKGRIMDNKTHKALAADDHKYITYALSKATITQQNDQKVTVRATGALTIAGKTKTVTMDVTGTKKNGAIQFSGSKALKMTDFGIDPPTAMLGTLKTGDDITIDFSLTLKTNTSDSSR